MRNTIYYKWFTERMSESDKEQYRQMSINQQKDWYIMYLEDHYQVNKSTKREEKDKAVRNISINSACTSEEAERLVSISLNLQRDVKIIKELKNIGMNEEFVEETLKQINRY